MTGLFVTYLESWNTTIKYMVPWYPFHTPNKGGIGTDEGTSKSLTVNWWEPWMTLRSLCFSGHWDPLSRVDAMNLSLCKSLSNGFQIGAMASWKYQKSCSVRGRQAIFSPLTIFHSFFLEGLDKLSSQVLWAIGFPSHLLQHEIENFHCCMSVCMTAYVTYRPQRNIMLIYFRYKDLTLFYIYFQKHKVWVS